MIVDANLLIYAIDSTSPHHEAASEWLVDRLSNRLPIDLPWQTIGAFVRITTNPRINDSPLMWDEAWQFVDDWLAQPEVRLVAVRPSVLSECRRLRTVPEDLELTGNLVTDAQLAAFAVDFGRSLASADDDFTRFPDVDWVNPLDRTDDQ